MFGNSCGCDGNDSNSCIWIILLLLCCCGGGKGFGGFGGFGGDNMCWIIILLLCCCGGGASDACCNNCC
jgi:hypothetical protein